MKTLDNSQFTQSEDLNSYATMIEHGGHTDSKLDASSQEQKAQPNLMDQQKQLAKRKRYLELFSGTNSN